MWICVAILLGLTALAAGLTRHGYRPHRSAADVRQRPAMPECVVVRSHHDPAARRLVDRRPGGSRRPYRAQSPAPRR